MIEQTCQLITGILQLESAEHGPPSDDDIPDWFKAQLVGPQGQHLILSFPNTTTMDAMELKKQRLALEEIDPNVVSVGTVIEGIVDAKSGWIWQTFYLHLYLCGCIVVP